MKIILPDYYSGFRCIADACQNTCCRGWEIELDRRTAAFYIKLSGKEGVLSGKLKKALSFPEGKEEKAHIVLREDGRCPFLTENGLCELITEYGEDVLSEICREHPRFRNMYGNIEETGLGLCCEEAARIILSKKGTVTYKLSGSGKEIVPEHRKRHLPEKMTGTFKGFCPETAAGFLLSLEILDPEWKVLLERWEQAAEKEKPETEPEKRIPEETTALPVEEAQQRLIPEEGFRQLAEYFLYRDGISCGLPFVEWSLEVIRSLVIFTGRETGTAPEDALQKIARMYSAEIEYCAENLKKTAEFAAEIEAVYPTEDRKNLPHSSAAVQSAVGTHVRQEKTERVLSGK